MRVPSSYHRGFIGGQIILSLCLLTYIVHWQGGGNSGLLRAAFERKLGSSVQPVFTCGTGCIDFSVQPAACIGAGQQNKVPWGETQREVLHPSSISDTTSSAVHHLPGNNVLALYSLHSNINHGLHDDLWSGLVWWHMLHEESLEGKNNITTDMTVLTHAPHPWLNAFLQLCSQAFHWEVRDVSTMLPSLPSRSDGVVSEGSEGVGGIICASEGNKMFMNGFLRSINKYGSVDRMKAIRHDLRDTATKDNMDHHTETTTTDDASSSKEHIVIFTRKGLARNILQPEDIAKLFDDQKYTISTVEEVPTSFQEQVDLFHSADLLVAPNGGWAPNVLWMKDTACLVELHLYVTDSWIGKFGLSGLFHDDTDTTVVSHDNFMTVTGDYHPPNTPIVHHHNRIGGDEPFVGELVAPDIEKVLRESQSNCARFLKEA